MATLLNQGAYGCIYYPGFTCKGNISKEKKYVTKLEIKDNNSANEIEISNIIKKIKNYQKLFGPIIKSCDIKLNTFNNKSTNLSECDVVNNYEFIQNDFKLIYINYINGTDIDKYIYSLEVPSIYLTEFINTFNNTLNSIKLLKKNDIIHFDLHAGNILYDLNKKLPIIIDFGLSINLKKIIDYHQDKDHPLKINYYKLKKSLLGYKPKHYNYAPESHFLSYILQEYHDGHDLNKEQFLKKHLTEKVTTSRRLHKGNFHVDRFCTLQRSFEGSGLADRNC